MNYFITKGVGESNLSCSKNETTSYDDAVVNAGIGNVNVITYSSMIAPTSVEVNYKIPKWGEVLYCIMARNDGKKGQIISCALMIAEVFKENVLQGSFVLEYSAHGNQNKAQKVLLLQLAEMCKRRNYGNFYSPLTMYSQNKTEHGFTIIPKKIIYQNTKIKKRYGTVICSICFIN